MKSRTMKFTGLEIKTPNGSLFYKDMINRFRIIFHDQRTKLPPIVETTFQTAQETFKSQPEIEVKLIEYDKFHSNFLVAEDALIRELKVAYFSNQLKVLTIEDARKFYEQQTLIETIYFGYQGQDAAFRFKISKIEVGKKQELFLIDENQQNTCMICKPDTKVFHGSDADRLVYYRIAE